MAQVLEEQQHQPVQHSDKRQFRLYNILVVIAMSFGSMSYGYSASKVTFLEDCPSCALISARRNWFNPRYLTTPCHRSTLNPKTDGL